MKILPFGLSRSSEPGYHSTNKSDESIIDGIISHNDKILGQIYNEYHQKIKKMVYAFRNTALDPDEIFQEGLTRAVINIREGKFRGESSFSTYLNSICRNICLKEMARHKSIPITGNETFHENNAIDFESVSQLLHIRNKLENKCRTIIDMRFGFGDSNEEKTASVETIASALDITVENARQRFKRCLDKLKEFILGNPELKNLLQP